MQGCPGTSGTTEPPKGVHGNQPIEPDSCQIVPRPEVRSPSAGKKSDEDDAKIQEPTNENAWDDMPKLQSMSKGSNDEGDNLLDPEDEVFNSVLEEMLRPETPIKHYVCSDDLVKRIQTVLTRCQPFPGDKEPVDPSYYPGEQQFLNKKQDRGFICVYDRVQGFETDIH